MNCNNHSDPSTWKMGPDKYASRRKGWQTVTCKVCGKFIGYKAPEGKEK